MSYLGESRKEEASYIFERLKLVPTTCTACGRHLCLWPPTLHLRRNRSLISDVSCISKSDTRPRTFLNQVQEIVGGWTFFLCFINGRREIFFTQKIYRYCYVYINPQNLLNLSCLYDSPDDGQPSANRFELHTYIMCDTICRSSVAIYIYISNFYIV